jgi:LmbE family N-acetylglucosaminyl deacetylase
MIPPIPRSPRTATARPPASLHEPPGPPRVACVFAHPDDDTYGVAGSLALVADREPDLTVILATSGEAGQIADATLATRDTLAQVREAEDRASWTALGLEPAIHFLRHPDGRLEELPRERLVAQVLAILQEARPDVVVTFGPDGVTGHADHVAIGGAATAAFLAAREAQRGGFDRLLHVAIPSSRLNRLNELLRGRGLDPIDSTRELQPRPVPDERIGMLVDCSAVYERKLEALRRHRTQAELEDLPFELWREILSVEAFVMAFPEREAGARTLAGLFDRLEGP